MELVENSSIFVEIQIRNINQRQESKKGCFQWERKRIHEKESY